MADQRGINILHIRYKAETGERPVTMQVVFEPFKTWTMLDECNTDQEVQETIKAKGELDIVDPNYMAWLEDRLMNRI